MLLGEPRNSREVLYGLADAGFVEEPEIDRIPSAFAATRAPARMPPHWEGGGGRCKRENHGLAICHMGELPGRSRSAAVSATLKVRATEREVGALP